ncbi:unnamed protein product [Closterium sp. Naga37s-1]|nr:unnamed protein product [Closterium sp. Naga37s-1]
MSVPLALEIVFLLYSLSFASAVFCYNDKAALAWEGGYFLLTNVFDQKQTSGASLTEADVARMLALQEEFTAMRSHRYPCHTGLLGRVAITGGYRLLCEPVKSRAIRGMGRLHLDGSKDEEQPEEWDRQFAAGVKVIALIGVPQGVLQIAACTPVCLQCPTVWYLANHTPPIQSRPHITLLPSGFVPGSFSFTSLIPSPIPSPTLSPNLTPTPSPNLTPTPSPNLTPTPSPNLTPFPLALHFSKAGLGFAGKAMGERGKDVCGGGGDDEAAEEGTGEWRPGENVGYRQDVYELSSGPGGTDMSVCGGEGDAGEGGAASGDTGGGGSTNGGAIGYGSGGADGAGPGADAGAGQLLPPGLTLIATSPPHAASPGSPSVAAPNAHTPPFSASNHISNTNHLSNGQQQHQHQQHTGVHATVSADKPPSHRRSRSLAQQRRHTFSSADRAALARQLSPSRALLGGGFRLGGALGGGGVGDGGVGGGGGVGVGGGTGAGGGVGGGMGASGHSHPSAALSRMVSSPLFKRSLSCTSPIQGMTRAAAAHAAAHMRRHSFSTSPSSSPSSSANTTSAARALHRVASPTTSSGGGAMGGSMGGNMGGGRHGGFSSRHVSSLSNPEFLSEFLNLCPFGGSPRGVGAGRGREMAGGGIGGGMGGGMGVGMGGGIGGTRLGAGMEGGGASAGAGGTLTGDAAMQANQGGVEGERGGEGRGDGWGDGGGTEGGVGVGGEVGGVDEMEWLLQEMIMMHGSASGAAAILDGNPGTDAGTADGTGIAANAYAAALDACGLAEGDACLDVDMGMGMTVPLPRPASRFFPKSASLPGNLPRPPPPAAAAGSGGGGGGGEEVLQQQQQQQQQEEEQEEEEEEEERQQQQQQKQKQQQGGLDVLIEGGAASDFQMAAPDGVGGLMGTGIGMGGEEELGEEWAMFLDVMDAPPILDDLDELGEEWAMLIDVMDAPPILDDLDEVNRRGGERGEEE